MMGIRKVSTTKLELVVKRVRKFNGQKYRTKNFVYSTARDAKEFKRRAHLANKNAVIVRSKTLGGFLVYISEQRAKIKRD